MRRRPAPLTFVLVLALALLGAVTLPSPVHASGAWTVHMRMTTCSDVLALGDTVWLASSQSGLLRYQRSTGTFESLTHEPSGLASNTINSLAIDRSRRLWAATGGKGVSRLSAAGTWDLVNEFDGLPSDTINVLRADGDTVWIGTTHGIALWNGTTIAGSVPDVGTPSPFRNNNVTGIVVYGDTLFVATDDGIYTARLSENLANWNETDAGVSDHHIVRLATDGTRAWALANGAIYSWGPGSASWQYMPLRSYPKNLRDDWGQILASTQDSLCAWDGSAWHAVTGAPLCDASLGGDVEMGVDPSGRVFAEHAGLLREQASGTWPSHLPDGPVENQEYNILAYEGSTWVCTNGHDGLNGGVSRWDGTRWHLWSDAYYGGVSQDTTFIESAYAFALLGDRSHHVWVGCWGDALERINVEANPYIFQHAFNGRGISGDDPRAAHSWGWSSAADSAGFVYIGGDTPRLGDWDPMGIDVYDPNGTLVTNWKSGPTSANLNGNQVRSIAVDKYGTMWVGFAKGGVRRASIASMGPDRTTLPNFRATDSLLEKLPIFGVTAHNDSIWVLTTSDVERMYARDSVVISTLDLPAGAAIVPTGAVHPLDVAADGTVWVGTTSGLRMYPPHGAVQDFDVDNSPLPDNYVTAVSVEPGGTAVWVATYGGVCRYDPKYVAPAAPKLPTLHVRSYPNPSQLNGTGIAVRLSGNAASYSGEVIDLGGRIVRRFPLTANGGVIWDGRDGDGVFVQPGVYFVHARGGGREAMARVVVLR